MPYTWSADCFGARQVRGNGMPRHPPGPPGLWVVGGHERGEGWGAGGVERKSYPFEKGDFDSKGR